MNKGAYMLLFIENIVSSCLFHQICRIFNMFYCMAMDSCVDKAPADPAQRGGCLVGQVAPQTHRLLNFVVGSLGLDSILLAEGCMLRDRELTWIIIVGGGGRNIETQGAPTGYLDQYVQNMFSLERRNVRSGSLTTYAENNAQTEERGSSKNLTAACFKHLYFLSGFAFFCLYELVCSWVSMTYTCCLRSCVLNNH